MGEELNPGEGGGARRRPKCGWSWVWGRAQALRWGVVGGSALALGKVLDVGPADWRVDSRACGVARIGNTEFRGDLTVEGVEEGVRMWACVRGAGGRGFSGCRRRPLVCEAGVWDPKLKFQ